MRVDLLPQHKARLRPAAGDRAGPADPHPLRSGRQLLRLPARRRLGRIPGPRAAGHARRLRALGQPGAGLLGGPAGPGVGLESAGGPQLRPHRPCAGGPAGSRSPFRPGLDRLRHQPCRGQPSRSVSAGPRHACCGRTPAGSRPISGATSRRGWPNCPAPGTTGSSAATSGSSALSAAQASRSAWPRSWTTCLPLEDQQQVPRVRGLPHGRHLLDVEVYSECVGHGQTGLLVANHTGRWYEALVELVENPALRAAIQQPGPDLRGRALPPGALRAGVPRSDPGATGRPGRMWDGSSARGLQGGSNRLYGGSSAASPTIFDGRRTTDDGPKCPRPSSVARRPSGLCRGWPFGLDPPDTTPAAGLAASPRSAAHVAVRPLEVQRLDHRVGTALAAAGMRGGVTVFSVRCSDGSSGGLTTVRCR